MKASNTDPCDVLEAGVATLEEAVADLDTKVIDVTLRIMVVEEETGPDE